MSAILTWTARIFAWLILAVIAAQVVAGMFLKFDDYYRLGELKVDPNPAQQGDVRLAYDGGPLRPFLGSYSVVVRHMATNKIACEARSGRFSYKPGSARPFPLTLAWWAPSDARCAELPEGLYSMETCWTVHDRLDGFLPAVTRCLQTLPFRVAVAE